MSDYEQSHPFDIATRLTENAGGYFGHTSEHYANMVGPFGGIIAATLLKAIIIHPESQGEPLSLTINYAAPISDGHFNIKVKEARKSRTTQHWIIELLQEDKIAVTGTAIFAIRRHTWATTEAKFPSVPSSDAMESLTSDELPAWVNNYDIRFIQGGLPGTPQAKVESSPHSTTIQWIQDKPKRAIDFLSLTAICDAFFPRVFVRRQKFVPASTVSLTIYFHTDSKALLAHGDKEVLGRAHALQFNKGFSDQIGEVWTPEGDLIATTHQIVYYKD